MGKTTILACIKGAGGWYKILQILGNLPLHTFRFFCDHMDARSRVNYPTPLADRLFSRLLFRGLTYRHKDESGASWYYGAVYQVSSRSSVSGRILCTASITESGLSYNLREVTSYQRNYCYVAWLITCLRINPYVWYPYVVMSLKQVINMLLFVYHLHYVIYKSITYAKWYMKITKKHVCFIGLINER